ncbi:MAG: shufflon system plasmid conjugative transfer pilus tip adhesin PilV [Desulfovibrionaceae bacterium]|nr:shufflon system plasmid conjugative transfer pilus tip adhesin PilV [Desulfovibrionaceae bacterium]
MKLIEVLGALVILFILLPSLANLWMMGTEEVEKRQAADQLTEVSRAAAAYVRKNYTTLVGQTTASSGPSITTAPLVSGGFLQSGFQGRNVWGQSYQIYFRQPASGSIQAVVLTTGGRGHDASRPKFGTATVPAAAAMAGGSGGFVPTGLVPGQSADTLRGAGGGWTLSLASLGISSPGAGHLGASSTFDSGSLGQDFLYRVAVPGHEELNAMQTELDMTDHAIRGVSEIQFTPRSYSSGETCNSDDEGKVFLDSDQGVYICRNGHMEIVADSGNSSLLKTATLAKSGDTIAKPTCPPGTDTTPQIFVSPAIAAAGQSAPPMTSFQAWAVSLNATQWRVYLRMLTTDDSLGWVYPEADYGRILVCTLCAKDS